MNNLSYKDIEEVFKLFYSIKLNKKIDVKEEEIILHCFSKLITNIKIKPLNRGYDIAYTDEDFKHVAEDSLPFLKSIHRIIEEIILLNEVTVISSNFIKYLLKDCIYFAQYLHSDRFWSNNECAAISQKIIDSYVNLLKFSTIEEFLTGKSNCFINKVLPNGILKHCLEEFSQIFNKTTWKEYPSYKDIYSWLLFNLQEPYLSDHVVFFLPPALFILDDWEQENKVFGIKALKHIMENTPGSELRWHGRAEVIFEALKHNLHSRESDILECAYPATILAASVLEKDPKYSTTMKKKYYDTVMDHLLSQMNFEEKLMLRTIYVTSLKLLTQSMGIFMVKWSDVILEVCANYMETYEGEVAKDRLTVLEILQIYIKNCWPRMASRAETILKMVFQLAYEINLESSRVKNKELVLLESKKVCDLLFLSSPQLIQDLCNELKDLQVDYKEDILYTISDVINKV